MTFFALLYPDGSSDHACEECVDDATSERAQDYPNLTLSVLDEDTMTQCQWCGVDTHEGITL